MSQEIQSAWKGSRRKQKKETKTCPTIKVITYKYGEWNKMQMQCIRVSPRFLPELSSNPYKTEYLFPFPLALNRSKFIHRFTHDKLGFFSKLNFDWYWLELYNKKPYNTPGIGVGPSFSDQPLAVKSKKKTQVSFN